MEATAAVHYEEDYHKTRHQDHSDDAYYDARARIAVDKFFSGIDKNANILDYGCGLGQNIFYLPNAQGYDISEYGLQFCRDRGLTVTNNLEDLADDSFDYVFSSHVLEHHPNPKQMVEEMRSKLRTGQNLLLVIPYETHGDAGFELDLNQHLFSWTFRTINNLLITSGFEILENKYLRGAGYKKWLSLSKKNFGMYKFMTNLTSKVYGIKEIMVVARKV